jgi:hypothetical protein
MGNTQPISDRKYILSGLWKCEKSPTGAHWWIGEDSRDTKSEFTCKYCKQRKEFGIKNYIPNEWRKPNE